MTRVALAALLALACPAAAWGDALPASARAEADATFSLAAAGERRYDDLDTVLAGATELVDREPLLVRDLYWRPDAQRAKARAIEGDERDPSLPGRRAAWLSKGGEDADGRPLDYPLPGPGEVETYPRITALVVDRVRRERHGATGLPEDGRLAKEAWAATLVERTREALRGPAHDALTSEARAQRARRDSLTSRNRALGLAAVVALVGVAWIAHRRLRGSG